MTCGRTIAVTGALATMVIVTLFAVWYPGAMSQDTFAQLSQARTGEYIDAWPPTFAAGWGFLDQVFPGPAPILAFQLILYFGSSALILGLLAKESPVAGGIAFLAFALWPSLHGIIGVVWIDIVMAAIFLAACAMAVLAIYCAGTKRYALLALSAVLLFLGIGLRHNAAAAAGPIAMLIVYSAARPRVIGMPALATLLFSGLAIVVVCFVLASVLSSSLTQTKAHFWTGLLQYDLAGIAVRQPPDAFNSEIFEPQTLDDLTTLYTPRSVVPLRLGYQVHEQEIGRDPLYATPLSDRFTAGNPEDRLQLVSAFLQAVRDNPMAYLSHRAAVFRSLTGLPPWQGLWGPVYTRIDPNEFGVEPRPELVNRAFRILRDLSSSALFWPATYMAVSIFGLGLSGTLAYRKNSDGLFIASLLYLSGLLHMMGLFFVAQSADFRYSHWLITTAVLASVITAVTLTRPWVWRLNSAPPTASSGPSTFTTRRFRLRLRTRPTSGGLRGSLRDTLVLQES